jgi:hypothetical protein
MQARTVSPGEPHSKRLDDVPSPLLSGRAERLRMFAIGIGETDHEIIVDLYGSCSIVWKKGRSPYSRSAEPSIAAGSGTSARYRHRLYGRAFGHA